MLNIPADSVVLSKTEYMILLEDAKARRTSTLTSEEREAVVLAIRSLKIIDIRGKDLQRFANVLTGIVKKLEA